MNRRAFLHGLVLAAGGWALDPERLLWRPGAKTIFLPSPRVTPVYVMPEWVTREVLKNLSRNLSFTQHVNRVYDPAYVGQTVHIVRRDPCRP